MSCDVTSLYNHLTRVRYVEISFHLRVVVTALSSCAVFSDIEVANEMRFRLSCGGKDDDEEEEDSADE